MARLVPSSIVDELSDLLISQPEGLRHATIDYPLEPLSLVRAGAGSTSWAGYLATPGGTQLGGIGTGWRSNAASGPDRLDRLSRALSGVESAPPAFVGFSFGHHGPRLPEWDGFAPAAAVIPSISATRASDGSGRLTVVVPTGRRVQEVLAMLIELEEPPPPRIFDAADHVIESRPAPASWREDVEEAVAAIRAGALSKVVLARGVTVRTDVPAAPFDVVAHLRSGYPGGFTFGWQEGDSVFVGASPELLVSRRGTEFACNPLAGSAQRGEGTQMDADIGEALLASHKDSVEHRLTVDDIVRRLHPISARLDVPDEPSLVKLHTVQHLSTWLSGDLAVEKTVLELATLLHPTPAVGGMPRDEALAFIDKVEAIDRGWYSGGIGWTGNDGDGEIAVALRCGLLKGNTAYLYGGAGIVAESDPEAELQETRLKFRPVLDILAAT